MLPRTRSQEVAILLQQLDDGVMEKPSDIDGLISSAARTRSRTGGSSSRRNSTSRGLRSIWTPSSVGRLTVTAAAGASAIRDLEAGRGCEENCWAAGSHPRTTNNLMGLRAVYEALSSAPPECPLLVQTDSTYAISVFTDWIHSWDRSGWKTSGRRDVANQKPIKMIAALLSRRDVESIHVRGPSGHPEDEFPDRLARGAAQAERDGHPAQGDRRCVPSQASFVPRTR